MFLFFVVSTFAMAGSYELRSIKSESQELPAKATIPITVGPRQYQGTIEGRVIAISDGKVLYVSKEFASKEELIQYVQTTYCDPASAPKTEITFYSGHYENNLKMVLSDMGGENGVPPVLGFSYLPPGGGQEIEEKLKCE